MDTVLHSRWRHLAPLGFLLSAVTVGAAVHPLPANAGNFTYTTIDVPGAAGTIANGINNKGQIVGFSSNNSGYPAGYIYNGGNFAAFNAPGALGTVPWGINDQGQIVGAVDNISGASGFLYSSGGFTTLNLPATGIPVAINNLGQMVGSFDFNGPAPVNGFLYNGGSFTTFDVPGAQITSPTGINNAEQIVGSFNFSNGSTTGFLDTGGNFTIIDESGQPGTTSVNGINNVGQIVGSFFNANLSNPNPVTHGFLYGGGSTITIDVPGASSTSLNGINDAGQIVGTFVDSAGVSHGFVSYALDVVDATAFPSIQFTSNTLSCLRCETLFQSPASALSSGGAAKVSVPANGVATLLLRLNNVSSNSATFTIAGVGDPNLDGALFDPLAGGNAASGGTLSPQTVNGQAFALYVAPNEYTNQPGDNSTSRQLTIAVQAGSQNLTQAITVYRPNPPTQMTQVQKAQAMGVAASLSDVSKFFANASIGADGITNLPKNVAIEAFNIAFGELLKNNDQIFNKSIELGAGMGQFLATAAQDLGKSNPISFVLGLDSLAFSGAALVTQMLADDPPDPNYTVVATPSALSFPTTGSATVDGVVTDYLNYLSLSAAELHAAERWQGAFFAGDTASQTLQQNAFNAYSAQAAAAQAKLTADNAALATVLQEPSLSAWPTAASDIAAAFRAQCGQPLPSDLNALLLTLTSQDEINTLVCNAVSNIQATDINFNFAPLLGVPVPPPTTLAAAVLPSSRSVGLGGTATAFATIINGGTSTAPTCSIAPVGPVPANFTYQTTNPLTNALTGTANTPIDIAAGAAQSFVIALTPTATLDPATVDFSFQCGGVAQAGLLNGVNTLLLSSSATPVPDIVALVATASNDGVLHIPGANSAGAFAVATVDVGAASAITVSANTGGVTLPLALSLCQTNPTTGACLASPSPSVTATVNAGATPTFGIFGAASGAIPFDPANNRIFVQFADPNGVTRGSTSVAVATQ